MKESTAEQFHNVCQHCKERLGNVDKTQAYTCAVCGKIRCVTCTARYCRPKVAADEREDYR